MTGPVDALYPSLHRRLAESLAVLPDKPGENADNALRALWHTAAGAPRSEVTAMHGDLPTLADAAQRHAVERLVERRLAGEPLAYLTGRAHFMGIDMLSGPGALIPRAETELLTRACIDLLRDPAMPRPSRVVDLCTGSGNIAFAIAHQVPDAGVFAVDLSAEAIALARRNGEHLGLARVDLRCGDLLQPFGDDFNGRVDVIACCPPYILASRVGAMAPEIAAHEPRLAFDGGPLGVTILLRLLAEAPRLLRPHGWLGVEVGLGQGPALGRRFERDPNYAEVRLLHDDHDDVRAILARRT